MFNSANGYSLSDIAAASRGMNDGDWGMNNGAWWIIILFLFAFNGNGWGFGRNNFDGTTTREEVAYGFDMNNLENGIRGIQNGICDGFYAMNTGMLNGFSGLQNDLCQGFYSLNNAIKDDTIHDMQSTFALQTALTQGHNDLSAQLNGMAADNAACCCQTQRAIEKGFSDTNYNIATQSCETRRAICDNTRDIIENNNAGIRSILDFLTQDKISTLQAENQTLKFAASQQAQNAYLVNALKEPCPIPAYTVPNPNCCYGYANACSCG